MHIEAIQGSSKHESEEKWQAARATGVTATQVAQLVVNGKLDEQPHPNQQPYFDWGSAREEALLDMARHKFEGETIISNDEVLRAKDNPEFLATPDGFSDTSVYECKTMKTDYFDRFDQGTWMSLKPLRRYFYQVQWQMFVTAADSATLIYEERLGKPGGFEPGRVGFVEISPDPVAMAECIAAANRHLTAAEEPVEPSKPAPAPYNPLSELERWCSNLAGSTFLPQAYQHNPANVMYAAELATSLGLDRMQVINDLQIIKGHPTFSANLIATLIRKAGHVLRVQGDDKQATAVILRADDPEFEYKAVWDLLRAKKAGLLNQTNWQKYPEAMLKARAITEVARMGAQDALGGVKYTPEELS